MRLYRERPGVISKGSCWVMLTDCYMYTARTFPGLLWVTLTQWEDDRHLVG